MNFERLERNHSKTPKGEGSATAIIIPSERNNKKGRKKCEENLSILSCGEAWIPLSRDTVV